MMDLAYFLNYEGLLLVSCSGSPRQQSWICFDLTEACLYKLSLATMALIEHEGARKFRKL